MFGLFHMLIFGALDMENLMSYGPRKFVTGVRYAGFGYPSSVSCTYLGWYQRQAYGF